MQNVNQNIENDTFKNILKEKLEGYSLPVGDDVWNKIEKHLDKQPRKIILWPWISGTAAAAVALYVILLFPVNDKKIGAYETTSQLSRYEEAINENVPLETVNQPVSTSPVKPERVFVTRKTKGEYAEAGTYPETDVTGEELVSDVSEQQKQNEQTEKPTVREKIVYQGNNPFDDDYSPIKKAKKRKSFGLSLGSGGNPAAMNSSTNTNLMHDGNIGGLRSDFYDANSESKTEERLQIEDFPEATHRAPLSFGLTVKKELNRTFSLETGLVYTFLDSRFENPGLRKKALLQLHYVGIPLNIQARIAGDKKNDWEIYLSAGGMIEKGIYSHYKQTDYYPNNESISIVSNEKIRGLQYSISLAPGIDYKIYRNYSVYFEPKISYYFSSKQPISARTEHPVVIGLNVGLRFFW
jgi:hypothetical protein